MPDKNERGAGERKVTAFTTLSHEWFGVPQNKPKYGNEIARYDLRTVCHRQLMVFRSNYNRSCCTSISSIAATAECKKRQN